MNIIINTKIQERRELRNYSSNFFFIYKEDLNIINEMK
jgi:hypothetical protein